MGTGTRWRSSPGPPGSSSPPGARSSARPGATDEARSTRGSAQVPRRSNEEPIVTTALERARQNGLRGFKGAPPQVPGRVPRAKRLSWFARDPAWPIVALLVGWPVWWGLGVGDYLPIVLAVPMIRRMYYWRVNKERTIRLPPGFKIWSLFLIVTLFSVLAISLTAPETVVTQTGTRIISWGLRTGVYYAVTVLLIYAGNLTEEELPRRRLAYLLGLVGIYTAAGGVLGVLDPHFQFTSPLAYVIPRSLQTGNGLLGMMLHPGFSQVQNILGYAVGRPRAPFDYTNMWGNALAIMLPWLIVAWWSYGNRKERRNLLIVCGIALVPVVYSLDLGGNGQLWMLLITSGFLGAALYCSFFLYGIWRYWRDPTPYGLVGVLVLILGFPFMLVYIAVGPPLAFTMLAYALLWKNDRVLHEQAEEAAAESAAKLRAQLSAKAVAARAQA